MLIFSKLKDEDGKFFGLVNLDKDNGTEIKKLVVGEREAVYKVDNISNIIFIKEGDKGLKAFKL